MPESHTAPASSHLGGIFQFEGLQKNFDGRGRRSPPPGYNAIMLQNTMCDVHTLLSTPPLVDEYPVCPVIPTLSNLSVGPQLSCKMDTGLLVIIFIATCMIISVISILSLVKYEWCPVLFPNNTVG